MNYFQSDTQKTATDRYKEELKKQVSSSATNYH